jgi:hypothetical protein
VSIKGRPYTWFTKALEDRSLVRVRAAASELDHISLADALRVLELIAAQEPDTYDRAATKWLARYLTEHHGIGLQEAGVALEALDRLAAGTTDSRPQLEALLVPRH